MALDLSLGGGMAQLGTTSLWLRKSVIRREYGINRAPEKLSANLVTSAGFTILSSVFQAINIEIVWLNKLFSPSNIYRGGLLL